MDFPTLAARDVKHIIRALGSPIRVLAPNGERRDDGSALGVYDESDELIPTDAGARVHVITRVIEIETAAVPKLTRGDRMEIRLPSGWISCRVTDFLSNAEGVTRRCVLEAWS